MQSKGTHAHAFVSSFTSLKDLHHRTLVRALAIYSASLVNLVFKVDTNGKEHDFVDLVLKYKSKFKLTADPNEGELAAFIGE